MASLGYRSAAVALFGVGSTPVRATAVEQALVGTATTDLADLDELGALAVGDLDPPGDVHATGPQRRRMAAALTVRALRDALTEANGDTR